MRGEGDVLNGEGERLRRLRADDRRPAPRDIVARSMVLEVPRGPRRRPAQGTYAHIDVRHLGEDVLEAKLPDITEFSRTYLGWTR